MAVQAHSRIDSSNVSVEQVAGAINGLIAERAAERLREIPAKEPPLETPKAPAPLKPRAPGVYFGLSSDDHHADPAIGSSDLKRLLQAPAVYWWHSHMNPIRPPSPDSPAKQKGRALHKLTLEGPEAFDKAFIEEPQPSGHPNALVTLDDLRAKCRDLGEPVSGTKAELSKRIKVKDAHAIIFEDILGIFRSMVERDGLEVLKPDAMKEVRRAAATITLNPHLAKAFTGGAPEVSVFWVEDGIPLKARLDYLKPRTIVDLKRCANQRERPVDLAIRLAIAEYRLDMQARHYLDGYRHLFAAARQGRVFGECPLPKGWERQIVEPDAISWTWVFTVGDGAPITLGRTLRADAPALNKATREIAFAKRRYLECRQRFGDGMWISDEPIVELLDTDLPIWMRENVEEYA